MLVVPISAKKYSDALSQVKKGLVYPIDAVELRLDYFDELDLDKVKKIKESCPLPVIFTLRSKSQGGYFNGDEDSRLKLIEKLCKLNPDYFDLELDISRALAKAIKEKYPNIQLICSYHDFEKTPEDLEGLLASMHDDCFSIYKIATHANSTIDSLRMLNFVKQHHNLCGLCMGSFGEVTRILAPIVNSALNFTCVDKNHATAPGQLDLETLLNIYHYHKINQKTKIYALLGDPVERSVGHIFHNQVFQQLKQNAVYIKLQLKACELARFFHEISQLPFCGFSVTMPLKESILDYLDELSDDVKKTKATNTLVKINNKFIAYNTDGVGALNAIEKINPVKNKKIIVLGAGGTAKEIVSEAIHRGAEVIVLNRTLDRAKEIAKLFGCEADSIDNAEKVAQKGYDVLINATSFGMGSQSDALLIPEKTILPNAIILDMVYKPQETQLLKIAKKKGAKCISGEEVFIEQAKEQDFLWLNLNISS